MPGMSGLDLLKTVRAERRELPVLVLSMHPAAQFAQRVIDAGGAGYVTKDAAPEELVAAIHRVQRGGVYRPVSELTAWRRPRRAPHEQLSDREYQVLRLMGAGLGVSRIASDLGLSMKTVSTYRARVLEKLGLETSAQLIRYAVENSLVDG
jgi:DNA-binding NarL/FixJ family response regulator